MDEQIDAESMDWLKYLWVAREPKTNICLNKLIAKRKLITNYKRLLGVCSTIAYSEMCRSICSINEHIN